MPEDTAFAPIDIAIRNGAKKVSEDANYMITLPTRKELDNLARDSQHQATIDTLAKVLRQRIAHAKSKPGKLRQNVLTGSRQFPQPQLPGTMRGHESNAR